MPRAGETEFDAVIVGAGPNGLAAAIRLAELGLSTFIVEAGARPGGGMRSAALTNDGFVHDVCSAVHPLGVASPFFSTLGLERYGLRWIDSPSPLAHVLDDRSAVMLERSVGETADGLGSDAASYARLFAPFVERMTDLLPMVLGPLRFPSAPWLLARFGWSAIRSMCGLARARFDGDRAPALLAGIAAHAMVPLDRMATSAFALVLAIAGHAIGWPVARGGSQSIADALVTKHRTLGGRITLGHRVRSLGELPRAHAYLFDTSPRALIEIAGRALPDRYVERLRRFRYGPGVFKVDWALDEPIPWLDARCKSAVTVHLGGTLEQIARAEALVHRGTAPHEPFVILGQPTVVDPTRAPAGKHVAWAYCHVPHGSAADMLASIERRIERFAPGFRDVVLARSTMTAIDLESHDPNYVGGDINAGLSDLRQLFFRPVVSLDPYATAARNIFLCSSSTPPGGGVHGMCGYWAAESAARRVFGLPRPLDLPPALHASARRDPALPVEV